MLVRAQIEHVLYNAGHGVEPTHRWFDDNENHKGITLQYCTSGINVVQLVTIGRRLFTYRHSDHSDEIYR